METIPDINNPTARRRGFTLLELLVVIAILGILAAVAFVGHQKVVNDATAIEITSTTQNLYRYTHIISRQNGLNPNSAGVWASGATTGDIPPRYTPKSSTATPTPTDPILYEYATQQGPICITPPAAMTQMNGTYTHGPCSGVTVTGLA